MTIIATKIETQGHRVLIYGQRPEYYIIAKPNEEVKEGDIVEFEDGGWNFGWFIKIVAQSESETM